MRSARIRTGPAVPAALAVLCFLAPLAAASQTRPANPELSALVPKPAAWSLAEAPRSYFPDNLFEYIDGAAESYLGYDFRELIVADLEKKGAGATLTLEIYDMGLPLNAFGIFAAERYPENKVAALGDLGYIEGEALNFLSGRFYVKMLAFGLGQATESTLVEVGAKVAAGIKSAGGLPALVRAFPKDGLVARSEKYVKKNFMGYEFLHDGYVATYKAGDRELEGFFIDGGSDTAAEDMLTRAPGEPGCGRPVRREAPPELPFPEPLWPAPVYRTGRERSLRRDARAGRARGGRAIASRRHHGRLGRDEGREVTAARRGEGRAE